MISIVGVPDGDDVEARVRNSGSKHVYLIETVFEWPDVPDPANVDWFKFDGDRYHNENDSNSPTISTGDYEKLKSGKTWKWEADFDDVPDEGIYGSFSVTLTFYEPDQNAHCSLSRSIFEAPPASTATPEPAPTETVGPSDTPTATSTSVDTATPVDTPTSTHTPTPEL